MTLFGRLTGCMPKAETTSSRSSGPSRSDSIQLMRVGGGHSAKLSIPRDTIVNIPGYGLNKINAAYALGGSALAVKTVKSYLGVDVDHVILVNFDKFPQLVDSMGGISYTGGCVVSRINGGFRNGGYTLRLKSGTTHIDGALTAARDSAGPSSGRTSRSAIGTASIAPENAETDRRRIGGSAMSGSPWSRFLPENSAIVRPSP